MEDETEPPRPATAARQRGVRRVLDPSSLPAGVPQLPAPAVHQSFVRQSAGDPSSGSPAPVTRVNLALPPEEVLATLAPHHLESIGIETEVIPKSADGPRIPGLAGFRPVPACRTAAAYLAMVDPDRTQPLLFGMFPDSRLVSQSLLETLRADVCSTIVLITSLHFWLAVRGRFYENLGTKYVDSCFHFDSEDLNSASGPAADANGNANAVPAGPLLTPAELPGFADGDAWVAQAAAHTYRDFLVRVLMVSGNIPKFVMDAVLRNNGIRDLLQNRGFVPLRDAACNRSGLGPELVITAEALTNTDVKFQRMNRTPRFWSHLWFTHTQSPFPRMEEGLGPEEGVRVLIWRAALYMPENQREAVNRAVKASSVHRAQNKIFFAAQRARPNGGNYAVHQGNEEWLASGAEVANFFHPVHAPWKALIGTRYRLISSYSVVYVPKARTFYHGRLPSKHSIPLYCPLAVPEPVWRALRIANDPTRLPPADDAGVPTLIRACTHRPPLSEAAYWTLLYHECRQPATISAWQRVWTESREAVISALDNVLSVVPSLDDLIIRATPTDEHGFYADAFAYLVNAQTAVTVALGSDAFHRRLLQMAGRNSIYTTEVDTTGILDAPDDTARAWERFVDWAERAVFAPVMCVLRAPICVTPLCGEDDASPDAALLFASTNPATDGAGGDTAASRQRLQREIAAKAAKQRRTGAGTTGTATASATATKTDGYTGPRLLTDPDLYTSMTRAAAKKRAVQTVETMTLAMVEHAPPKDVLVTYCLAAVQAMSEPRYDKRARMSMALDLLHDRFRASLSGPSTGGGHDVGDTDPGSRAVMKMFEAAMGRIGDHTATPTFTDAHVRAVLAIVTGRRGVEAATTDLLTADQTQQAAAVLRHISATDEADEASADPGRERVSTYVWRFMRYLGTSAADDWQGAYAIDTMHACMVHPSFPAVLSKYAALRGIHTRGDEVGSGSGSGTNQDPGPPPSPERRDPFAYWAPEAYAQDAIGDPRPPPPPSSMTPVRDNPSPLPLPATAAAQDLTRALDMYMESAYARAEGMGEILDGGAGGTGVGLSLSQPPEPEGTATGPA